MQGWFWSYAWRNLRRNPRRSLLTALAIASGLLCLIVFQALKVGMHRDMIRSMTQLDLGSLQVHAAGYETNLVDLRPIKEADKALRLLAKEPEVRISPRLKAPALLLGGAGSASVVLSGVDPDREAQLTIISQHLVAGGYLGKGAGILLGAGLAESLDAKVGSEVGLLSRSLFGRPVSRHFPVVGLYRSGSEGFDRSHVFLRLAALQEFLQADDLLSEIAVATPAGGEAALAERLRRNLPDTEFQIRAWQDLAPDLVQLIQINDGTMTLLVLIVFFIVALGIANTMTMTVYERFREFGILAAMGTRPGGIRGLVLAEALLLGLLAALLGSLLGWLACLYLARYGIDLTPWTSANRYFAGGHVLRARLQIGDLLLANLVTLLTALLAGLYPAWRASRLQPVETLRHT